MSLSEAQLLDDVRQRLFAPTRSPHPHAIGLELELIPVHRSTRTRALATNDSRTSTSQVLSQLGRRERWNEQSISGDPPSWTKRDGARISFEPGGQLEISTAPHPTASEVIDATQSLVVTLRAAMSDAGIDLLARGVDPYSDINAVPLQLHRDNLKLMRLEGCGRESQHFDRVDRNFQRANADLRRRRGLGGHTSADQILDSIARYCRRINDSGH